MTHTLADKQRTTLKSVRRRWRTVATWLEHNNVGFALLAHESPAHRALVEMVPARVRELREIADLERSAAHTEAVFDEAIGQLRVSQPKPADGAVP
jgi:hypothetical protein